METLAATDSPRYRPESRSGKTIETRSAVGSPDEGTASNDNATALVCLETESRA
ncbi:hypothetical protein [Haloterrigena salinisoli]|uniref:hypothetical protein n=1 Tax=Haloterrigena salinisoli TaxID=3132747 RepID=UPI0030D48A60